MFVEWKICVIVPTYNNAGTLGKIVGELLKYVPPSRDYKMSSKTSSFVPPSREAGHVIVVDDGSSDNTQAILQNYAGQIEVIRLGKNAGKGRVLRKGFEYALSRGFRYAITIDSDGQHFVDDIPVFLEAIKHNPGALLVGSRNMKSNGIPGRSRFGHNFSNFWFKVETGISLPDTQCGYRLYPLESIKDIRFLTSRYEFEIEVLVRSAWKGIKIIPVPIKICYFPPQTRISHFRPFTDFARVSVLNTVLVCIALLYVKPSCCLKKLAKRKDFFVKLMTESLDSRLKISCAVGLGVLMGIWPFWGFQLLLAFAAASIFRLNRPLVLAASNISIPPLIPLILYLSLKTGDLVLGTSASPISGVAGMNFEIVKIHLLHYVVGSFLFGAVCALLSGSLIYGLLGRLAAFEKKRHVSRG